MCMKQMACQFIMLRESILNTHKFQFDQQYYIGRILLKECGMQREYQQPVRKYEKERTLRRRKKYTCFKKKEKNSPEAFF